MKLLPVTQASNKGSVHVLATLLLKQLPENGLGKEVEVGPKYLSLSESLSPHILPLSLCVFLPLFA